MKEKWIWKEHFFFSKRIWCVQLSGSTDIWRWSGPFNQIARNKSDWYTVIILLQKMCFNDFGRISWAWCTIRGYHKCWKNFNTVPRRGEDGTVQKWWRMNTVFFFFNFQLSGGAFQLSGGALSHRIKRQAKAVAELETPFAPGHRYTTGKR